MAWGDSGIVLASLQPEVDYIPKGAALIPWRLCTNFVDVQGILDRFRGWPDYLIPPETLLALYKGDATEHIPELTVAHGATVKPSFPYLDEAEGTLIQRAFEAAKPSVYPPMKSLLEQTGSHLVGGPAGTLLMIQTQLVLALRKREREVGIWGKRTPEQKFGTVFALGSHIAAPFTRVNAYIVGRDMRLSFPWGGIYGEYAKLLPLMEDPYAGWILRTADDELQVLTSGLVSRPLSLLELIDTSRVMASRGQARLNVNAVGALEAIQNISALADAMRSVASGASGALGAVLNLQASGRYSYLEGPGDYLEMAYAVLLGLLLSWAANDGLLDRPPKFTKSGENWVAKKPLLDALFRRKPRFHGLSVLREADRVWNSLLGHWDEVG